jgi:electron transfer flavoprotein alpha subunit
MTTLVLAEHDGANLHPATASVVAAARAVSGPIHVLVSGHGIDAVARAAARIAGVTRVLVADAPHLADGLAEPLSAQMMAIAERYTCLLAAATSSGKRVMPRVAAQLGVPQVSEITAVIDDKTFERPMYAGNVIATVRVKDEVVVGTVRVAAFEAPDDTQPEAECVEAACIANACDSRFVGRETMRSERPELTTARTIVSGGRGLGSGENYHRVLTPLADKLDAALGASRAAVDAGYVPNDHQVGQTGKIVAPGLYVAIGISGAIQHLAGMKDAKTIVAINSDPEAPIFAVADVAIVADLFEAVPALVAAL